MAAPPISERHLPHFHRRAPMKEAVRAATTANITISTALNNGDSLDGLTLATGDRVLVKDQSTGSQNGVYVVGTSPVRDYDESTDDPAFGYLVYVREGTSNGGTLWKNTNTSTPTIDTTALTFAQFTSGGPSFATPSVVLGSSAAAGAASTVIRSDATIAAFDATSPSTQAFGDSATVGTAAFAARRDHKHAMPTAAITTSGLTQATARLLGRTTASTGAIEEITVGSGLSLSAGSLTATGTGAGTVDTATDGSTTVSNPDTVEITGSGGIAVTVSESPSGTAAFVVDGSGVSGGGGGPSDYVSGASGTGQIIIPGLAGSPDIRVAGTNDDEFDTTDTSDPMTGWTTLGTPTTHNINSTAKSHYYVKQSATGSLALVGIYKACPTIPFTMTAKLSDAQMNGNYNMAGIFIAEASPGKITILGLQFNSGNFNVLPDIGFAIDQLTNRTTYSSTPAYRYGGDAPVYLRIVVTSSSNVAYLAVDNGWPIIAGAIVGAAVGILLERYLGD